MTILSLYSLNIIDRYKHQIEGMFERHIFLSEIETMMNEIDENLLGFLSSKSSTRLNEYNITTEELKRLMGDKPADLYNMEDLIMKNIKELVNEYIGQATKAIEYKRQRNARQYYQHYQKSEKIKAFIYDYIDQLDSKQLTRNSKSYLELVRQIPRLQTITYIIVITLILLSICIVYLITSRMVRPFSHLSYAAEEIAHGNFNTEDIIVDSEDEFLLLATAFNKMKNSIGQYVDELTKQAETEAKLKDQQMKNMKMVHLLDNAKLYALQSQINPHFLFNTINAGVQMSIMERATKTSEFLESMSRLFRYNIKKMGDSCTLKEEIENIKDYYDLLKVRFGQRIQFQFYIDPTTIKLKVPPLILQPLVENAYIHGLSGLEEGGTITLKTIKSSDSTIITVEDTGKGMEAAMIQHILNKERDDTYNSACGIGIRNVRDRLELFYHTTEIFSVESSIGEGVKVVIRIPHDISMG